MSSPPSRFSSITWKIYRSLNARMPGGIVKSVAVAGRSAETNKTLKNLPCKRCPPRTATRTRSMLRLARSGSVQLTRGCAPPPVTRTLFTRGICQGFARAGVNAGVLLTSPRSATIRHDAAEVCSKRSHKTYRSGASGVETCVRA